MDDIIVSMNDNVFVPQEGSNFVSPDLPVYVQENVVGSQSEPCTVEVGQTTTGEPFTNAEVVNVGSSQHAVLNFTIPRGADGADGLDGVDGLDGEAATVNIGTVTTVEYDQSATVTNVGTSTHAILDISLPRGQQGEQGLQGVAGVDGISPRAYVEAITGGGRLIVEDSETTTTVDIMDGTDGTDGQDGFSPIATVTPTASGATISITDAQGTTTANITNGVDGTDGTDGTDGFSPIATVTQNTGSATISITDANGTTTANVYDGTDGTNGTDGSDGFSPIATVTQTASGATISITDAQGTTTANITNGINGTNGTNGSDGFSPIATVTQNTGSATISITDANGTTTATVYDGTTPDTSVTSYSISGTPAHSAGTNSYTLKKMLSIVVLDVSVIWMNSITADSWTNIGTIPSAVRPSSDTYGTGVMVKSNGSLLGYCRVEVETNGSLNIKCSGGNTALSGVSISLSWFV